MRGLLFQEGERELMSLHTKIEILNKMLEYKYISKNFYRRKRKELVKKELEALG